MFGTSEVVIQQDKRFSDSIYWELQRQYFDEEGIDAWVNQVPFYVTSNPFLANCYAEITIRLAQDWIKRYPDSVKEPFYIMELGTGSGRLSYYILKKLSLLQKQLKLEDIKFCYVMTDFTESNLQYWKEHPQLKPYIDSGVLDFAIFDMESDKEFTLRQKGITIKENSIINPLMVFANYIFDTVSHDIFTVKNGKIQESLVKLTTYHGNMKDGKPQNWEEVAISYDEKDIELPYYNDPAFDASLEFYKNTLTESHFLVPIAGMRALRNLRTLCNDRMLVVSSDKGYTHLSDIDHSQYPQMAFHGSFSMMVNFHAIAKYFEHSGGSSLIQSKRSGIETAVYWSGFNLEEFPEAHYTVWNNVERFSPADYFVLHRNISENFQHCKLNTLSAHMAFTDWDPHIYQKLSKQICEQIPTGDSEVVEYLASHMDKLAENFYYLPKIYDVMFDIGIFFHTLRRYKDAATYYELSEKYFGEQFGLIYNIALCQYNFGEMEKALFNFRRAQKLNPDSDETKEWINFIERERADNR